MLFVAVLIILVSSWSVQAAWENGDDGIDRPNGDLPKMPITLNNTSDPVSVCAKLCQNNILCHAWAYCKPNCGGMKAPLCYLKANITSQSLNPCRVSGIKNASLIPPKFVTLPVGSISPQGWLKQQLGIQAAGLSGHLPLFWADIENSSWIGGNADGGLHERTPYWLNGFIPLAYQLKDSNLIAMVEKYISYILAHQTDSGWLGLDDQQNGNCYWSKYPVMFALRQYYEATGNSSILPAMFKFLHTAHQRMFTIPLGGTWSGARWQDLVLTVHWLLDYHSNGEEQFLWDLAETLHEQGFDWKGWYAGPDFPKTSADKATLYTHGVNNGQALKSAGVWYRQSHNKSDWDSSYQRIKTLDTYHGQASGIFACDEHLAGTMPSRGTELCTVVEAMFSYEVLFGIQGDVMFAERAEQLGFNALPATITSDMWAHQYLQQDNEINAIHSDDHIWVFDGPDSTLYGLAPNYGCCTANFNQGWPKLTQSTVMVSPDGNSFVISIYAPVSIEHEGTVISIDTNYPFNETVIVNAKCTETKTLIFRIPSWTNTATVQINTDKPYPVTSGDLHNIPCNGEIKVTLHFPMNIRVQRRYNNAAAIYHGPLLYGLEIKEEFKELRSYEFQSKDYQVTPGSPWNYAIHLTNDSQPEIDLKFVNIGWKEGSVPFSIAGAPSKIMATGRIVDSWGISHNAASAPPMSPVTTNNKDTSVILLPFGATDLRISEIPTYM